MFENVPPGQKDGLDALNHAARINNYDGLEMLLKAGADVNSTDVIGTSALFAVVNKKRKKERHYCVKAVNMLIEAGADVNTMTKAGETPLVTTAWFGYVKCMKSLLEAGADVNQCTDDLGATPVRVASYTGHHKCLDMLLEAGADVNKGKMLDVLILASRGSHYKCVNLLLRAGADVNVTDNDGSNALFLIAKSVTANDHYNNHNRLKCIQKLLRAGAKTHL